MPPPAYRHHVAVPQPGSGAVELVFPCLLPGMAQEAPAPQWNAGQKSFLSCLTTYVFQINFFWGWKAIMSWEKSSSIRGLGRKHLFFQEMTKFRETATSDTMVRVKYTYVSQGSSKSSFGPCPKSGEVQKAPEVPVSETPIIQGIGLQVIKSLWHFDFYLGFSLQRVGTWSCFIQADSEVHALVWRE